MIKCNNTETSSFSLGKIFVVVTTSILLSACGGGGGSDSNNNVSNSLYGDATFDLTCHLIEDLENVGDGDDCQSVLNPSTGEVAVELSDVVASADEDQDVLFSSYTDYGEATFILYDDYSVSWQPSDFSEDPELVIEDTAWVPVVVDREIDDVSIGEAEVYIIEVPEHLDYDDGILLSKYNGRVVLGRLILDVD